MRRAEGLPPPGRRSSSRPRRTASSTSTSRTSCTARPTTRPGGSCTTRMEDRWQRYANPRFLEGIGSLCLDPHAGAAAGGRQPVPEPAHRVQGQGRSAATCRRSCSSTACATASFRPPSPSATAAMLDYLPEPDIFHDIAGHVPMHTDRAFADTLVRFGDCAHTAAEIVAGHHGRAREDPPHDQHLSRRWRASSGSPSSSG